SHREGSECVRITVRPSGPFVRSRSRARIVGNPCERVGSVEAHPNPGGDIVTDLTVIGLGAMGGRIAEVLLAAGHRTTVWNRTPSRADPLVAQGAIRADDVAEAVAASPLVLVCVLDYAA